MVVTVGGDRGDRIGDEASKKAAKEKERKRQQRVKLSTAAMARAACRVNDSCGDGDSGNKQEYGDNSGAKRNWRRQCSDGHSDRISKEGVEGGGKAGSKGSSKGDNKKGRKKFRKKCSKNYQQLQ